MELNSNLSMNAFWLIFGGRLARRSRFPLSLLLGMVVLGLGRINGWAASTVYSTGFEADEGFDLILKLSGQNGWRDSGFKGQGIVTNFLGDPGQQVYIGFNRPADPGGDWEVWRPVDFRPQAGQSEVVTFSVRFAIHPSTTTNHDDQSRRLSLERGQLGRDAIVHDRF